VGVFVITHFEYRIYNSRKITIYLLTPTMQAQGQLHIQRKNIRKNASNKTNKEKQVEDMKTSQQVTNIINNIVASSHIVHSVHL
jgi:capsular polysaccharide biosynthesis protein